MYIATHVVQTGHRQMVPPLRTRLPASELLHRPQLAALSVSMTAAREIGLTATRLTAGVQRCSCMKFLQAAHLLLTYTIDMRWSGLCCSVRSHLRMTCRPWQEGS